MNEISPHLQVASIIPYTKTLGPGPRFVLYLQGCKRMCSGCIASSWQDPDPKKQVEVQKIFEIIYKTCTPEYEGITISGGEPLEQLEHLHYLLSWIKEYTSLGQILYTGYTYQEVLKKKSAKRLLQSIDLLITGPYIQELDNDRGLLGSTNQSLIFLTSRYRPYREFLKDTPRTIEIYIRRGEALLVGIPSKDALKTFHQVTGED